MAGITLRTARQVVPMIYAYTTPEIARHNGWTKIGYTEQSVDKRLKQQTHTADVLYHEEWRGEAPPADGRGGGVSPPAVLVFANVRYLSSAAWSAFASAMAFSWAAGGQSPRKPLCALRGPRIGCKSPEVNSADFKILPPAKYLYAGLPAERRGLPLPYFSSAAWSAFASAMAFSWAAGGQSS